MIYEPAGLERHLAISKVYDNIASGSTVLDVGCSTGFLGMHLKNGKNCRVVGIENDVAAIRVAKGRLDKVIDFDLEKDNSSKLKLRREFDYVILADVLEHLCEPEMIVRNFSKFLKPDGKIIISLPNVAHPLVRLNLLLGKWDYTDIGIMDRTHVKFYTHKTAKNLIEKCGLRILGEFPAGKFTTIKTFSAQFVFVCAQL